MTRKIAMVTGAGRGIGKGIAIQLAKAGYDLAIHYSTTAEARSTPSKRCVRWAQGQSFFMRTSVTWSRSAQCSLIFRKSSITST